MEKETTPVDRRVAALELENEVLLQRLGGGPGGEAGRRARAGGSGGGGRGGWWVGSGGLLGAVDAV